MTGRRQVGLLLVPLVGWLAGALGGCGAGKFHLPGGLGGGGFGAGAGGSGFVTGAGGSGGARFETAFQAALTPKLDLLFMIDNSPGMAPLQAKFLVQIPVFMNVLKMTPAAGGVGTALPDIHVAVVSSDTGPGAYDLPAYHCPFQGDAGRFQSVPRGICTMAPLTSDQSFLTASMNQTVKNYTGDISDALTCIAALGDQGCGFEGQLKAVRKALDPFEVPNGNDGFLRPDAALAVILLTNEDDCSVPDDSDLLAPTTGASSSLGPYKSFRCNEFGHLCNIGGTLAPPPATGAVANLQGCISNDTATGRLTKVSDELAFLKSLKSNANQIFVAAFIGPTTPYTLGPDADGDQSITRSCTQNADEFGYPAVRIQQWVAGFGDYGLTQSICENSFAPSLSLIADQIVNRLLGTMCITNALVDSDPGTPGVQPQCQATDVYVDGAGKTVRTPLPACSSNSNTPPCWSVDVDATRCPGPLLQLHFNRGGSLPPSGLATLFSCPACVPGVVLPGCP